LTDLNQNTPPKVRVFYDGSCPLCLVEIGHYKRADSNGALRLIDVSSDDFIGDAQITQQAAMARFHVRLADDRQLSGAHGFVEVWKVIPSWIWLAKLANIPGVLPVLELFYTFFLLARPLMVRIFKGIRRTMGKH
jgi:predicted DCC family thiol-disulfide oxidoreductase YuxK